MAKIDRISHNLLQMPNVAFSFHSNNLPSATLFFTFRASINPLLSTNYHLAHNIFVQIIVKSSRLQKSYLVHKPPLSSRLHKYHYISSAKPITSRHKTQYIFFSDNLVHKKPNPHQLVINQSSRLQT